MKATTLKITGVLSLSLTLSASVRAGVLPNDGLVDGRTIAEWSAEWWKWIWLQPTNSHPWLDPDGRWATNAQPDSSVFFVAGVVGDLGAPFTRTRTFTIPEDKYLLFGLLNVAFENIDAEPLPPEKLCDAAASIINTVTDLHATIDGVPVPDLFQHRVMCPVYSYVLPDANNFKTLLYGHPITGLIDPEVSDGYWIMVEPLSPGVHVINWGSKTGPPYNLDMDIIDIITVVPTPLPQRVQQLISSVAESDLPQSRQRPVLASLKAAEASFGSAHLLVGIHHLRTFQRKVRAQIVPADAPLANELIQSAESIIQRAKQTPRAECPGRRSFGQ